MVTSLVRQPPAVTTALLMPIITHLPLKVVLSMPHLLLLLLLGKALPFTLAAKDGNVAATMDATAIHNNATEFSDATEATNTTTSNNAATTQTNTAAVADNNTTAADINATAPDNTTMDGDTAGTADNANLDDNNTTADNTTGAFTDTTLPDNTTASLDSPISSNETTANATGTLPGDTQVVSPDAAEQQPGANVPGPITINGTNTSRRGDKATSGAANAGVSLFSAFLIAVVATFVA